MFSFVLRRIAAGVATLLVSTFAMYLLVAYSFARSRAYFKDLDGSNSPNKGQMLADRAKVLELDQSIIERYWHWLTGFLRGDLGASWQSGQKVTSLLEGAIASTLQMVTAAMILSVVLGVLVGVVSALRQYSSFDYSTIFISFVLYSLPAFWVAVLLKQWGAIGFNDFLTDPVVPALTMIVVGLVLGLIVSVAVGGRPKRRLQTGGITFAATIAAFVFLQVTSWWEQPRIGPVLIALTGTGLAFGITALIAGLKNRLALYAALSSVAAGLVLYFPLQTLFRYEFSWLFVLGLGLVTLGVGIGIGYAWRGPDPAVSARTGALTALFVAAMIFVDKVLSVWPAYVNANAIGGRPVPTIGDSTPNLGGNFWVQTLDNFMHLLLPTVALVLIGFAAYTRYSRATMLEVLSQDYIRTARAKGLPERTVIMRHGFRNTMIPLATVVPMDLVMLLGGAIITERVFSRPGMGTLFITSLDRGDIDPVMAYLVIVGGAAIVANILADLLYAALDPRIRVNA